MTKTQTSSSHDAAYALDHTAMDHTAKRCMSGPVCCGPAQSLSDVARLKTIAVFA